jgi:hypothetical protein
LHGSLDDTSYQGKTVEKGREPSPKKKQGCSQLPTCNSRGKGLDKEVK